MTKQIQFISKKLRIPSVIYRDYAVYKFIYLIKYVLNVNIKFSYVKKKFNGLRYNHFIIRNMLRICTVRKQLTFNRKLQPRLV